MAWQQFSLDLHGLEPDAVEAVLEAQGALAVTYTDAEDSPVLEPGPGETPLWPATRITALFDPAVDPASLAERLRAELQLPTLPAYRLELLEDRVWEREWLRDFHAMRFGRRLWVCPGDEAVDQEDALVVRLDPGLAFGTGTHATTALCLEWLDGESPRGRVLDFGCGSGILAVAALRLGASGAVATDNDAQALAATRENAHRNAVADRLTVAAPADLADAMFDTVVANILAGPLIELAPVLARHTAARGRLALSGILADQGDDVVAAYAPWFRMEPPLQREDWLLISGTRRQD